MKAVLVFSGEGDAGIVGESVVDVTHVSILPADTFGALQKCLRH